jgi:hypothetical protein
MRDISEVDPKPGDRLEPEARKPWHPPAFIVVDVAATNVVCHGGTDGGPMNSGS